MAFTPGVNAGALAKIKGRRAQLNRRGGVPGRQRPGRARARGVRPIHRDAVPRGGPVGP